MLRNLKQTDILSKISNIASYFWFLGTLTFILIILTSTKNFTVDPCYGQGCPENKYLIPMLSSFFIGSLAFGLTLTLGLLRIILKAPKWKPPLHIDNVKMAVASFFIAIIFMVYTYALFRGNAVTWGQGYTGFDLFNAVNSHRKSVGVSEVKLSEGLCDNLVSRWKAVKEGKQHEGFNEWVEQEGIQSKYGYKQLVELYISAQNPSEAIAFWVSSPGHKIQLENPRWTDGCAYASEGYGVVVMGSK